MSPGPMTKEGGSMEKINRLLTFVLLLGAVLALLGLFEIQEYQTVDEEIMKQAKAGEVSDWVASETAIRTHYRLVL